MEYFRHIYFTNNYACISRNLHKWSYFPDISKVKFMDTLEPTVSKPYFEDVGPKNVTVVVGESTTLKCRVRHPGDRTVSAPQECFCTNIYFICSTCV